MEYNEWYKQFKELMRVASEKDDPAEIALAAIRIGEFAHDNITHYTRYIYGKNSYYHRKTMH